MVSSFFFSTVSQVILDHATQNNIQKRWRSQIFLFNSVTSWSWCAWWSCSCLIHTLFRHPKQPGRELVSLPENVVEADKKTHQLDWPQSRSHGPYDSFIRYKELVQCKDFWCVATLKYQQNWRFCTHQRQKAKTRVKYCNVRAVLHPCIVFFGFPDRFLTGFWCGSTTWR